MPVEKPEFFYPLQKYAASTAVRCAGKFAPAWEQKSGKGLHAEFRLGASAPGG
jgi:hypothetical protein